MVNYSETFDNHKSTLWMWYFVHIYIYTHTNRVSIFWQSFLEYGILRDEHNCTVSTKSHCPTINEQPQDLGANSDIARTRPLCRTMVHTRWLAFAKASGLQTEEQQIFASLQHITPVDDSDLCSELIQMASSASPHLMTGKSHFFKKISAENFRWAGANSTTGWCRPSSLFFLPALSKFSLNTSGAHKLGLFHNLWPLKEETCPHFQGNWESLRICCQETQDITGRKFLSYSHFLSDNKQNEKGMRGIHITYALNTKTAF